MSRNEKHINDLKILFRDNLDILRFKVGNIIDADDVEEIMEGVDICINTAAMKRIQECEENIRAARRTNVGGLVNLLKYARRYNVEAFMQISTDKAYLPQTTYGSTKRMAEEEVLRAQMQ